MPLPLAIFGLPDWAGRLALVALILLAAVIALAVLRYGVERLTARVPDDLEPQRDRERRTAIGVFATAGRYLVLVAAVVGVVIALLGGGAAAALTGTAFLAIIVGFAAQRLLTDVIAGAFILFEGQYAVGDLVALRPQDVTGVVEEVGLRITVVRDLNGDVCFVPNGEIQSARRLPRGNRVLELELLTRAPGAVESALVEAGKVGTLRGVRFATGPHLTGRTDLGDGLVAMRVRSAVAPGAEWLVRDLLLGLIRARSGDALAAEPVVVDTDPSVVARHQSMVGTP